MVAKPAIAKLASGYGKILTGVVSSVSERAAHDVRTCANH
jgi:hypothetical protein